MQSPAGSTMSQPEQSFDHDLDALLRCVDMCTSRALEALEDDGGGRWVAAHRVGL